MVFVATQISKAPENLGISINRKTGEFQNIPNQNQPLVGETPYRSSQLNGGTRKSYVSSFGRSDGQYHKRNKFESTLIRKSLFDGQQHYDIESNV